MKFRPRLHLSILSAFVLTLAAACGGGGGGGGGGTNGFTNFDLLVTDAPVDDLLSFRATVSEAHLVIQGGGESANLIAAPVALELLGLQGGFAWLASQDLPAGTYTGVRLVFTPGSYDARSNDGSTVAINATSDEMTVDFASPLVVTDTGYKKVVVDVDLASSLTGSVATPPLDFAPAGSVASVSSSSSSSIDEIKGTLSTSDAAAGTLVLDAFVDDDGIAPLGQVLVRVPTSALLVADDGATFATRTAFFAALVDGSTHLEVHGNLISGAVTATRIEIEDNLGGGGAANLVKIEGLVLAIGANQLTMSIADVERGLTTVTAALGGTLPATLTVHWDGSTVFFLEEHELSTPAALQIGQKIKAKFAMFTNAPFTASRIEIEDENAENEGIIQSVASLPTITVHLEDDSPAILGGQVSSTTTNVLVDLAGARIFLDADGEPLFPSTSLLTGMKVEVRGPVVGSGANPSIDAASLKVYLGRIEDGTVTATSPGLNQFTLMGGTVEDPFGDIPVATSYTVSIVAATEFKGDADTRTEFFQLFAGLGGGEDLVVSKLLCIATGPGQLRAYEVDARVE
jgi:hypothetical protein